MDAHAVLAFAAQLIDYDAPPDRVWRVRTRSPTRHDAKQADDNDVVIAEGTVRAQRKDGAHLELAICDVFDMKGGKISLLVSYLMPTPGSR